MSDPALGVPAARAPDAGASVDASIAQTRELRAGRGVTIDVCVEPQPVKSPTGMWKWFRTAERAANDDWTLGWWDDDGTCDSLAVYCPLTVGQRVGVREPWRARLTLNETLFEYEAGGEPIDDPLYDDAILALLVVDPLNETLPWQPAATMPAWAIRTFATVATIAAVLVDGAWCWHVSLSPEVKP